MNEPTSEDATDDDGNGLVESVYALRQAAIDHGLALAQLEAEPSGDARDQLLDTQVALEEKTAAAIDQCSGSDG